MLALLAGEGSSLLCLGTGSQREGSLFLSFLPSLSPCPGFDMTPNYVDSSPTGIVVSPWCSCRGSGNMEEECEKFLRDFTENPCLRKSSQSFPVALMSQRGPVYGCLSHPLLFPLGCSVLGLPQQPIEMLSFVLLETRPPQWSVGQPQFSSGGSSQGQKFLVCFLDSFSQVSFQHLSLVPLRIHSPLELVTFLFKSSDCYSKG